jgi:O-antigen/teichoic acid export membrane protein
MVQSRSYRIGLVISALLGAVDVVSIGGAGADDGPPAGVLAIGLVLGLVTLAGVWLAWRGDERGFMAVVVSRVLSALLGIPAFFADDAPDWAPAAVGAGLVVTAVALWLLYSGRRRPASV